MGAAVLVLWLPVGAFALNAPTVAGGSLTWAPLVSVSITGGAGGADAVGYEYRTSTDSGATWSGVSAGASALVNQQGETHVQFRAVDGSGTRSAWAGAPSAEGVVRIDRTTPTTPAQPSGATPTSAPPALTWAAATDTGGSGLAGYRVLRSGTQVGTPGTAAFTDSGASDGSHVYRVLAYDNAGNVSLQSPARTVVYDGTPPSAPTLTGAQPVPLNTDVVVITASGSTDALTGLAGYEHRTSTDGGATWTGAVPGGVVSITDEGETLVQVRSVDAVGNRSAWTPSHSTGVDASGVARIDRTAPARPAAPQASGWPLTLNWSAMAGVSTYRLLRAGVLAGATAFTGLTDSGAVDDAPPPAPSGVVVTVPSRGRISATWTAPADAGTPYTYTLRAVDAAANQSEASPVAAVTATSGVAKYVVQLDGMDVAEVTSPVVELAGLDPSAARTLTVVAVDAAGNASPASAGLRVLPDPGPPPTLTLSARRVMVKPGTPIDIGATVRGISVGAVEWRLDGELLATGTQLSHVFTVPGRYRILATVLARTGEPVHQPMDVVVDDRPPNLTLLVARNRLNAIAADTETGVAGVKLLRGPGGPRDIGPSGIEVPDGRYAVIVRATDLAGNTGDLRQTVMVDTTAPLLRVTAPGVSNSRRVIADISVQDRLSGVRSVSIDGVPLSDGVTAAAITAGRRHVLVATDRFGNRATLVLNVAVVTPMPVHDPALDGVDGDQLRYRPRGGALTGVRRTVLRGVQMQMIAVQALPPGWRVTDRFTVALLRQVQRYQRLHGLPANGTLGPRTRTVLDRDAGRNQVTQAGA